MYKLDIKALDNATGRQPGSILERLLEVYLFADAESDGRNTGKMSPAYITAITTLVEEKILIKIEDKKV